MEHIPQGPETIFEMIGRIMRNLPTPRMRREYVDRIRDLQAQLQKRQDA